MINFCGVSSQQLSKEVDKELEWMIETKAGFGNVAKRFEAKLESYLKKFDSDHLCLTKDNLL